MNKTVKFAGKSVKIHIGRFDRAGKNLLRFEQSLDWWGVDCDGPLYDLNAVGEGDTPQEAATDLEKRLTKVFKLHAKALGYTVTG